MAKPAPKGGAMRLAPDVWDVLTLACDRKGMTAGDRRVAAEAIIRSYADAWAGDQPTSKPTVTTDQPFNASGALDSLIDSI